MGFISIKLATRIGVALSALSAPVLSPRSRDSPHDIIIGSKYENILLGGSISNLGKLPSNSHNGAPKLFYQQCLAS